MIKGKAPYPFETIALAVDFSTRLESLIVSTQRFCELFNSRAVFIHAGKRTSDKEKLLSNYLLNSGFNDSNCSVHWQDGSPVEVLLATCKEHVVDLLIIGAQEKDSLLKYYMGTVSREICRRAKCSVLMLTPSGSDPVRFNTIVVNGHEHVKTIHTINASLYVAEKEQSKEVLFVDEMDIPLRAVSTVNEGEGKKYQMKGSLHEEKSRLNSILDQADKRNVPVKVKTISGRSGYTIAQFAQSAKADLLIVNSPDHHLNIFDRVFSHDLEYVLADLPCSMLIVNSRVF